MSDFSGLPLVIEASDLLPRLDSPELILVDLTSTARYTEGHLPGARFVDPKRTQLGQPPAGGRGGDVFACGGAGDGAFLHHGHEQAQRNRVEFHGVAIIARPRPAGFCHAGLRWQRRA